MTRTRLFPLNDEAATRDLGRRMAMALDRGDLLLLSGDLGAGKTFLARAIIQTLAGNALDVPSPTFNLAIPYELRPFPVTHYDLYRLSGPDETEELGVEDALEEGAAIVEWPDRLHPSDRRNAISVTLTSGDTRTAEIAGPDAFMERLDGA
ncbi:tRNA (adenosine(37)-N6)-threonylcarbamoyltransferase complex ATPase subunit type 1 TsaE [Minwuia sp.]|uniref:tRNA (adenosine(37)-N6)-threonylcarbamoyltransferase complex ATPase subunit type 1 TsaE n=1 Tax=Minwuia sp. TaxID=2493630 RepID=UPI003A936D55